MTIDCIENGSTVLTPGNHPGELQISRRERKLVDDGANPMVTVKGLDGILRRYPFDCLQEYHDPEPTVSIPIDGPSIGDSSPVVKSTLLGPEYLGDGVYVRDMGYAVSLSVGDHRNHPVVILEPDIIEVLNHYWQRCKSARSGGAE